VNRWRDESTDMKQAVLALDQGTTSSRAILFGRDGETIALAQREFRQIYPREGWVEHDPLEIWETQRDVAREALDRSGLDAGAVASVGITNQRETTVIWDRATGEPLANAIVWQDRRTADRCAELIADGYERLFRERAGLPLDPYFSGTKIAWLLDHVPEARKRAERGELAFGTTDTWLIWNLTGGARHVTDPTNASRTLLYNLHTGDWDDELLAVFGVPRSLLPEIVPSSGVVAEAGAEWLGGPVPVAGIAGDQQAALFGQACHYPGMAKNTYGTGCFLLLHTGGTPAPSKTMLTTAAATADGSRAYALEGSVFVGGAVVQWLRDGLGIIEKSSDVEALALGVPDAGGVVFVPAFTGLGAPYWDPYARGGILGLTRGTTAAHIARAAVQSIALQSAEVLFAMEADTGSPLTEIRVDGGATANNLLMQYQADLLQVPVIRPKVLETTALGAAYLAGLAVGFWSSPDEVRTRWAEERVFAPRMSPEEAEEHLARYRRAVARVKGTL
jgi:glycerol kinase